jgi:hypothetical protein
MYIRNMSLLTLTALAVALLTSCGGEQKPDPGTPVATKPKPAPPPLVPGTSQNLTRVAKLPPQPTYHVDRFGPANNPAPQKSFEIAGDTSVLIMGWAIDGAAKKLPGGIEVLLDQAPFAAHTGVNRTDVADFFKRPDYAMAGFELIMPPGQLSKGEHSAAIRVISNDKTSYYQTELLKFVVN